MSRNLLAILGFGLAALMVPPAGVLAADVSPPAAPAPRALVSSPESLYRPDRFEVRGSGFYHC